MKTIRAIYRREMLKFIRNRVEVFSSIFMGIIFLFIFMWAGAAAYDDSPLNYHEYMVAGIVIITGFMGGFTGALSIINDKSSGFMKEFLIAPIRRELIVVSKLLALVSQSAISITGILITSLFISGVDFSIMEYLQIFGIGLIAAGVSAAIGMFFSTMINTTSGFMAMQTVVLMPMMFLSGAYIPLGSLPTAIRVVAMFNPLTYLVTLIRSVGTNGDLPEAIKDAAYINLTIGDFNIEPWMMWIAVAVLGSLMILISLRRFANINMSSKVDYNEVM